MKQEVLRSLYDNQTQILKSIETLHCPEGYECDLTYGNGTFWKNYGYMPPKCYDIHPLFPHVIQADSCHLPIPDVSLQNCVFDPPFLTYIKNARDHGSGKMAMSARFGGYYSYKELEGHYQGTISECHRILKHKGKLVFKCQDIIHNHKMHCTHAMVIRMAQEAGFRLVDLFVLAATHRMPSPQKGTQKHARIFHSYFLVFEKMKRK